VIILSETDNLFKAYSVQEIASMLGIGKTKTRELLDSGILPVTKVILLHQLLFRSFSRKT
jgi:hypothetical protein